jgi:hypothetical protein
MVKNIDNRRKVTLVNLNLDKQSGSHLGFNEQEKELLISILRDKMKELNGKEAYRVNKLIKKVKYS